MVFFQYVCSILLSPVLLRLGDSDLKTGRNLFRCPFHLEAEAHLVSVICFRIYTYLYTHEFVCVYVSSVSWGNIFPTVNYTSETLKVVDLSYVIKA